jgi:hypothetical protein
MAIIMQGDQFDYLPSINPLTPFDSSIYLPSSLPLSTRTYKSTSTPSTTLPTAITKTQFIGSNTFWSPTQSHFEKEFETMIWVSPQVRFVFKTRYETASKSNQEFRNRAGTGSLSLYHSKSSVVLLTPPFSLTELALTIVVSELRFHSYTFVRTEFRRALIFHSYQPTTFNLSITIFRNLQPKFKPRNSSILEVPSTLSFILSASSNLKNLSNPRIKHNQKPK